jgi:hypothetical protein
MVTRTFVGSVVAFAAGLVLLVVAGGVAYARGSFIMDGPDVVGVQSTPFGWSMVALAVLAVLTMVAAMVAQFVAWLGAVMNTAQLEDKTWFVVLLVLGLLSFGFIAMIVYIAAGPDDPSPGPRAGTAEVAAGPRRDDVPVGLA